MDEPFLLKWLDPFKRIFERSGIDYPMMRRILKVKLTMDARRAPSFIRQTKRAREGNPFLRSLWMYGLVGLSLIPLTWGSAYLFELGIFFAVVMFMVMTSMIADFSAVLLDIKDKSILWTKPIGLRTLNAAKTLHLCFYLFLITGTLAAPVALAGLFRHGPLFFLLLLVNLILMNLLIIAATTFIYLFILKFFDGERLKDLINYVQIFLSFAVAIGYQLLIRTTNLSGAQVTLHLDWWQLLLPPLWFSASFGWLLGGIHTFRILIFALTGLFLPLLGIVLYRLLSPIFAVYLQKLSNQAENNHRRHGKWMKLLAALVCRTREERTFFHFAWLSIKNDRAFKLKVYPSIGLMIVLPFIFMITSIQDHSWSQIAAGKGFFNLYFSLLLIPAGCIMLKYSSSASGSWIFDAAPVMKKALIFSGTLKAFLMRLYLPCYLLLSIVFLVLFQFRIGWDVLIVFLTGCLYCVLCYRMFNAQVLPFSMPFTTVQENSSMKNLFMMLLAAPFAGIHALISFLLPDDYLLIYALLLLVINLILWRIAFKSDSRISPLS
ncbi:MAG: hypothetical protein ABF651_12420 [Sporolactobacillus sp.]